jgi:Metallo-beta-lactamase superfamily
VLTKAFIAAMKKINPKPFRHLVNTHHHPDHMRGNCFFLPIEIVAHEKCREAVLEAGLTFPMRPDWREGIEELKLAPPTSGPTRRNESSATSCAFIWSFRERRSQPSILKKYAKRAKATSPAKGCGRSADFDQPRILC